MSSALRRREKKKKKKGKKQGAFRGRGHTPGTGREGGEEKGGERRLRRLLYFLRAVGSREKKRGGRGRGLLQLSLFSFRPTRERGGRKGGGGRPLISHPSHLKKKGGNKKSGDCLHVPFPSRRGREKEGGEKRGKNAKFFFFSFF